MSEIITNKVKNEPNVVPLCDILLVLLIIFMVITPTLQKGIDVNLPEEAKDQPTNGAQIVLSMDCRSHLMINNTEVEPAILASTLQRIFETRNNKVIFVKADKDCVYKDVMGVLDICRGAGITNICMMNQ